MVPFPVVAPIVFAVTVPIFMAPVAVEGILMAVQEETAAAASPQVKFLMVLPCTLVGVLTVVLPFLGCKISW